FLDILSSTDESCGNTDHYNKSLIVYGFNFDSLQNFNHLERFYLVNHIPRANAFMDSRNKLT
ncbi:hypothetical protein P7K49_004597, partial [Saguinus oedipus]